MRKAVREWSPAWWCLVATLALVVTAHIVFDLIDIDGSDLPDQLFHGSLVAVTGRAESARQLASAASLAWHALDRPAGYPVVSYPSSHVTRQRLAALPATHGSRLARRSPVHVSRACIHTSPPAAADPARPVLHRV